MLPIKNEQFRTIKKKHGQIFLKLRFEWKSYHISNHTYSHSHYYHSEQQPYISHSPNSCCVKGRMCKTNLRLTLLWSLIAFAKHGLYWQTIYSIFSHALYLLPLLLYPTNTINRPPTPLCTISAHPHSIPEKFILDSLCLSSYWSLSFGSKISKMYSFMLFCWITRHHFKSG